MSVATQHALSSSHKKRGVVHASLTKLRTRLDKLEATIKLPDTIDHVKRLSLRLQTLTEDFKLHHYAIVELVDDEEHSCREQEVLDEHDEEVSRLVEKLSTSCLSSGPDQLKVPALRNPSSITPESRMPRKSSFRNSMFPPLMAIFLVGKRSGSSSQSRCMGELPSLTLRSWLIFVIPSRVVLQDLAL